MINRILFFFANTITIIYYYNIKIVTLEQQVTDLNKKIEDMQNDIKSLRNESIEKDEKLTTFISSNYLI